MPKIDAYDQYYAPDRTTWRQWLADNHDKSPGIWLIYYKKESGKPRVAYGEAVEEALCFGWIDSLPRKIDDERYMQLFTPRKPKSVWSKLNKERVERLIANGLMTPAGMAKVEIAQQNGSWNTLDEIEALTVPDDLVQALAANPAAEANFAAFSPSVKKGLLAQIQSAKRPETRSKRITQLVVMAEKNKRLGFDQE